MLGAVRRGVYNTLLLLVVVFQKISAYSFFLAASARKRRALSNFFYVEILRSDQIIQPGQTLVILIALNTSNNNFPLLASEACAMLANTARGCVENCGILQLVGLPCGQAGPNKNVDVPTESESKGLGTGGMAGIAVVVVILLVAVLFGAIFYYRRKYKVAKVNRIDQKKLNHKPRVLCFPAIACCLLLRLTFDLLSKKGPNYFVWHFGSFCTVQIAQFGSLRKLSFPSTTNH